MSLIDGKSLCLNTGLIPLLSCYVNINLLILQGVTNVQNICSVW